MALLLTLNNHTPVFGVDSWLAENATVAGDVVAGKNCTVWFQAVIRGDVHYIRLGDRVNVQDGAILHCTYQKHALTIGNDVSIGHRAIVHGCTIEDNVLIGMGAIVMDGCIIRKNSIVAAGAVVTEGTEVPEGCIYAGVPAKKVKEVSPEVFAQLNLRIAGNYLKYADWYRK